jgi:hypothetical protein
MANERRDHEEQTEPSAEQEQVSNDADISQADRKDLDKVKNDEWTDDRFQATDN